MNNVVRLIYCLALNSNRSSLYKIKCYAKYATLMDKRTLKLGFKDSLLEIDNPNAPGKLLEYLKHKDEYQEIAHRRWEAMRDMLGAGNDEDTWE